MSEKFSKEEMAEIKAMLKNEILEEIKDEKTKAMELAKKEREEQKEKYAKYVEEMKASSSPWVDITGWSETNEGVKVELEWNDAFIDYLAANGVTGTDEEATVQRWVTLLMRDMADQMDQELRDEAGDFE